MKTNRFLSAVIFIAMAFVLSACEEKKPKNVSPDTSKSTEESAVEKTGPVKIGNQVWMSQNLNDPSKGGKCYEDKPENCEKYGRLYTWNEAIKACPEGWYLPSDKEWTVLTDFLGEDEAGNKLKSKSGWNDYNGKSGNGTDDYGFFALPGGNSFPRGDGSSGGNYFTNIGNDGFWWSSTEDDDGGAWYRSINRSSGIGGSDEEKCDDDGCRGYEKSALLSVRCLKDKEYKSVKIGEQVWMAENLNEASKGGKCYENKPENCEKYGRLYTWKEAMRACPSGWHLPSDNEWQTLVDFAGEDVSGKKLKAKSGWNEDGNGTDDYGFSALPGGDSSHDSFSSIGNNGYWWSATEFADTIANRRNMNSRNENVGKDYGYKSYLYSVRCLKD